MTGEPATEGAERLDRFMARANARYYATHNPFADFTTSPEISQLFGEIIGVWLMTAWMRAGQPDPFLLVEAGPGRGTLMHDLLRAMRAALPACRSAAKVHFIENSPTLRAKQATLVPDATWHDTLDSVPAAPMILVANEFLDALPIRQFVRRGAGWSELYVAGRRERDVAGTRERKVAGARWVEVPLSPDDAAALVPTRNGVHDGSIVEINEAARSFVDGLADRIARVGGAALLIDYGPATSAPGDSLQAIAGGRFADPLKDPGHADLTAHVDFSDLAAGARQRGAMSHGPVTQGTFLTSWGLFDRARTLAAQGPEHAQTLQLAALRLTDSRPEHPGAMGSLFKVMGLSPLGWPDLLSPP